MLGLADMFEAFELATDVLNRFLVTPRNVSCARVQSNRTVTTLMKPLIVCQITFLFFLIPKDDHLVLIVERDRAFQLLGPETLAASR